MFSALPKPARRIAVCIAAAMLVALSGCSREDKLAPDLAFNFRCHGAHDPASETAIEKFLASRGFIVFNEERVRRQYNLALYPLAIDGYNARHWMLYFRGINEKAGDKPDPHATIYSVGIYSPPPTRHDTRLEAAAQNFVAETLKCDVVNVSHGDNAAERAAFFDKVYGAEQKRIAAGMRCDKRAGKPLDTKCPS